MNTVSKAAWAAFALAVYLCVLPSSSSADDIGTVTWFQRDVGDGVTWHYYLFEDLFGSPQSISYIEADLTNPNVDVSIPYLTTGFDQTSDLVPAQAPNAVAGINGTYFAISASGGHVTYMRIGGSEIPPGGGLVGARRRNGALTIDGSDVVGVDPVPTTSGGWDDDVTSVDIIAAGPMLADGGVIQSADFTALGSHCTNRHPRSAAGITASNTLILLTVDGRTDSSAGMTCQELAEVMEDLGCIDSLNLDGGGSTTLWAAGEPFDGVINYPSDNSNYDHLGQRSVSNAIAVSSTAPALTQWDARLDSLVADTLTRSGDPYTVTATYTNLGTETWTTANVSVITSRAFGRTSDFVPSGQELTFFSMSPTTVTTGNTATFTLNLVAPPVALDTIYSETFALSNSATGYFGPADSELGFSVTVRPELTGAPPTMIVQGGASGINNQWYDEPSGSWANSSVSFTVPGVTNGGTQRYVGASATGRSARFRPIFDADGIYTVEVAFPSSTNSITVDYAVTDNTGTQTFVINQHPSGGQTNTWVELGQFEFTTGQSGGFGVHSIVVSNPTNTGNRFYSGAVRLDYVSPLTMNVSNWFLYK